MNKVIPREKPCDLTETVVQLGGEPREWQEAGVSVPERGQEEGQPLSLGAAHLCAQNREALLEVGMQKEGSLRHLRVSENLPD